MKRLRIKIPVEPKAKGRPRVTFKNGKPRTYTPENTMLAENTIRTLLLSYKGKGFPAYTPVRMTITFFRQRNRWAKDKLPVRKPDIDNFAKMVLDAANGILFADDAQITKLILSKRWSDNGNTKAEGYIKIDMEEDTQQ